MLNTEKKLSVEQKNNQGFTKLRSNMNLSLVNITNYKYFNEIYSRKRVKMPMIRQQVTFNIWEILRDAVGKDLSRFSMPGNLVILIINLSISKRTPFNDSTFR